LADRLSFKIDLWEIILPSIVYKEAKAEYDRVKAEKMVLKAKLDAIKSRNTPLVEKQKLVVYLLKGITDLDMLFQGTTRKL